MSDRHSVGDLLREWGTAPTPVEDESVTTERRARLVSRVAREIRETSTRRSRRARGARIAAWLAVAAVVALLVGGLFGTRRSSAVAAAQLGSVRAASTGVVVLRAGHSEVAPLDVDRALESGDAVSTVADARAALHLMSGVDISVAPSTRVLLTESNPSHERIELGIGEVSVRVPPLGTNRSFSVETPDALVVVHGTAFSVRVRKVADKTVTDVEVSEGKVSVRRGDSEVFLLPGQSWSSESSEKKSTQADTLPQPPAAPAETPALAGKTSNAPFATGSPVTGSGAGPKVATTESVGLGRAEQALRGGGGRSSPR